MGISSKVRKIPANLLKKYFESVENKKVEIKKYEKLGKGWHGVGYKIVYKCDNKEK